MSNMHLIEWFQYLTAVLANVLRTTKMWSSKTKILGRLVMCMLLPQKE